MGQIHGGCTTFSGVLDALGPCMSVVSHSGQQVRRTVSVPLLYHQGQDSGFHLVDMKPRARHLTSPCFTFFILSRANRVASDYGRYPCKVLIKVPNTELVLHKYVTIILNYLETK